MALNHVLLPVRFLTHWRANKRLHPVFFLLPDGTPRKDIPKNRRAGSFHIAKKYIKAIVQAGRGRQKAAPVSATYHAGAQRFAAPPSQAFIKCTAHPQKRRTFFFMPYPPLGAAPLPL